MVVIGTDSHKRTHTVVAVDGTGRKLAEKTVVATSAGHLELVRWAARFADRTWALEDCRHLSRRLSADLLRAGEIVVRVPPKLMAGARRSSREPGKSDPIDALAVARAALREDLPAASLDRAVVLAALDRELAEAPGTVGRIARELVMRIRSLTATINDLEREIGRLVAGLAPSLLDLTGCGALTAAKLVGETAGIGRFRSRAAFARHNGTAPLPVWSGNTERHRLSRTGNRQLNVALHRIAATQLQRDGRGKTYVDHRRTQGDTKTEAIRALRRRISDEVFRRMRHDEAARAASPSGFSAAA
jgi:transposase